MDIEMAEDFGQSSSSKNVNAQKSRIVRVDEAHPFDLESYIQNYKGRTVVDRLVHIISTCPDLAPDALQLAIQHVHQSRNPGLYQAVLNAYDQVALLPDFNLPKSAEVATLDSAWAEDTLSKNQAERAKLEVELKTYSNNMIKESVRMAHRDLGDFYLTVGDLAAAYKNYTKSREYCTTSQQVLDISLTILRLLVQQRNYGHIQTFVYKAEAALDAAISATASAKEKEAAASGVPLATGPGASRKSSAERERVQTILDFVTGLSHLGQGNYEKAAFSFLRLGPAKHLGDLIGTVVAPGDIAIYGTLCALSSFSRSSIKAQVQENSTFGVYIEQEPYIRELIEAYMSSRFKTVLELLSRYSSRHYLDIHLSSHVHDLTNLIRNWAVVLYFQPFSTIKLDRMSAAFGWSVEEVEQHVVSLIQSGEIKARIDRQNKVLQATKTDQRAELYSRALKAAADLQIANRKLLLRMQLQQADLIIKPPKSEQQQLQQQPEGRSVEMYND